MFLAQQIQNSYAANRRSQEPLQVIKIFYFVVSNNFFCHVSFTVFSFFAVVKTFVLYVVVNILC